MKTTLLFVVLIFVLFSLISAQATIPLQSSAYYSRVSIDQNATNSRERAVQVVTLNYVFGVRAVAVTKAPHLVDYDAILFGMSLYGQTIVAFGFYESEREVSVQTQNTLVSTDSAYFAFASRFLALVEYEETNGIEGLQANDTILSTYSLSPQDPSTLWQPLIYETINIDGTSQYLYVVTAVTMDDVFKLQWFITGRPLIIDNNSVDSDGIKLSIEVNYYNYSGASNSSTSLIAIGLVNGFRTVATWRNTTIEGNEDGSTEGLNIGGSSGNAVQGYLLWDKTVNVTQINETDGKGFVRTVHAEYTASYQNDTIQGSFESKTVMNLIFYTLGVDAPRPNHIFWDPQLGASIDYSALSGQSINSVVVSVWSLIIMIFIVIVSQS